MMHAYALSYVLPSLIKSVGMSAAALLRVLCFSKACWVVKCVLGSAGCCTEQRAWKHCGHTCSRFSGALCGWEGVVVLAACSPVCHQLSCSATRIGA